MRRRRLRTRTKERLIRAGLVALVLSAPVVTAATLLKAASGSGQMQLAAPSAAAESEAGSPPNVVPLVAGVLYTNGPVKVNWNGVDIAVENSSYAYTGGEVITTAPNAMGILRLTGGNTIFICPGSQVRLSRGPSGSFSLNIAEGSSRFMFDTQTPFEVKVNDTVLTPETAVAPPPGNGEKQMYVGEAQAQKDGGCVLCGLKNNMRVSSPAAGPGGPPVSAIEGQIVTVPGTKKSDAATTTTATVAAGGSVRDGGERKITKVKIPEKVFSTMAVGIDPASSGAKGIGYLCKCQKLKEYAEEVEQLLAKQAEEEAANVDNGETQTADASDASTETDTSQETEVAQDPDPAQTPDPAETPEAVADSGPPEPDPAPPVEPPTIPDLVVADSGPPDPFVPGLTPAAGDPAGPDGPGADPPVDAGTPIILPPPLIPGSGSGGGGVVSPS